MIRFKALNVDGDEIEYSYENKEELEKIWRSDDIDMDVPANDAPIYDVEIDGELIALAPTVQETNDEDDCLWFEDLLTYLGIEIWG